jgi:hypothetical protein
MLPTHMDMCIEAEDAPKKHGHMDLRLSLGWDSGRKQVLYLLFVCLFCCAGWGYIVTFEKVLTIYHIYHI